MAKFEKKLQAQLLRKKGWSINAVADKLSVAKSSVSIWTRDIQLSKEQRLFLKEKMIKAGHKGRLIGAEMNRKKKIENIRYYKKIGKQEISNLSKRELLLVGLGLYWGEGSKSDKLSFVNSDPRMISFMFYWFKTVMGVKNKEFMPRIFINEIHKTRIKKVKAFWSKLLKLPEIQFGNPTFLKVGNKKIYENYNDYYGILAIRIRKSTDLKYKILGLIEGLKDCNIKTHL